MDTRKRKSTPTETESLEEKSNGLANLLTLTKGYLTKIQISALYQANEVAVVKAHHQKLTTEIADLKKKLEESKQQLDFLKEEMTLQKVDALKEREESKQQIDSIQKDLIAQREQLRKEREESKQQIDSLKTELVVQREELQKDREENAQQIDLLKKELSKLNYVFDCFQKMQEFMSQSEVQPHLKRDDTLAQQSDICEMLPHDTERTVSPNRSDEDGSVLNSNYEAEVSSETERESDAEEESTDLFLNLNASRLSDSPCILFPASPLTSSSSSSSSSAPSSPTPFLG